MRMSRVLGADTDENRPIPELKLKIGICIIISLFYSVQPLHHLHHLHHLWISKVSADCAKAWNLPKQ